MSKTCTKCGASKPISEFTKNKNTKDGYQTWCRLCYNEYMRAYCKENVSAMEHAKTFNRFYMKINGRCVHMLNNAKQRAKKLNVPYSLNKEWVDARLRAGVCEVTGIPFVYSAGGGKGHRTNEFSPSLDRIDQNGGYVPENCRVVVWIYNRARGAFSDAALDLLVRALAMRAGMKYTAISDMNDAAGAVATHEA